MSLSAFSNYEIKKPNSLPPCKDETLDSQETSKPIFQQQSCF